MKIRIGTRTSRLAQIQTNMVAQKIKAVSPETEIEIVPVSTLGDRVQEKPIGQLGTSGVFTDDIEEALRQNIIDVAVHSAKDLPAETPKGLEFVSVLPRADYRDAIITRKGEVILNSPDFIVGTGSKRRMLNAKRHYPNITFRCIRGNVDVRLEKLDRGEYDAVILAMAGIKRLGLDNDERFDFKIFSCEEFITEPCQAIIAVESRENDIVKPILEKINDQRTYYCFETERYVLKRLNPCFTEPLGAYSQVSENKITLTVSTKDGQLLTGTEYLRNRFALADRMVSAV
ncbi:hydroxymethylbilane synthase [Ruminococcus sp.]|uniref:hydroxymethylbilane synthase n=1 Tax=Ruminococcus sp. TaxID=41978 RepID=UPI002E77FA48|nr:hydroxymethylbilane synthase [Ruminococcus sp.]MEE1264331.1 hydroxymethylbilane synthase [Ruminococcus sp.]